MKAERLAQALHEMTKDAPASDVLSSYESFIAHLRERGSLKLLPRILAAYTAIVNREKDSGTVIRVAKDRDVSLIRETHDIREVPRVVVDENLVGGYQVETPTKLIDASHKNALLKIYQNIIR